MCFRGTDEWASRAPLTSWSVFNPWARRVSVRGQRGVAVGVCVGEAVVVGFRVSHVWKHVALLRLRMGEDPVQRSLQVIVLNLMYYFLWCQGNHSALADTHCFIFQAALQNMQSCKFGGWVTSEPQGELTSNQKCRRFLENVLHRCRFQVGEVKRKLWLLKLGWLTKHETHTGSKSITCVHYSVLQSGGSGAGKQESLVSISGP